MHEGPFGIRGRCIKPASMPGWGRKARLLAPIHVMLTNSYKQQTSTVAFDFQNNVENVEKCSWLAP